MHINIVKAQNNKEIKEVKSLFIEYAQSLNFDLCFQGFDEEINSLPGKYSQPDGIIFLAKIEEKFAGCIALRNLGEGICEMKRLYVRPQYRGFGIGKILCDKLFEKAKSIGYEKMRLDTIANQMQTAIELYKSYGFYEISAYYDNPQEGVVYMEMKL